MHDDGEIRDVQPRSYQAIVLKTCRGCSASRVASTAVNVVVGDKDVKDPGLQFIVQ
jgi:hypothetical protein